MTTQPSGPLGEIRPRLAAIDWFTGKPLGEVMTLATQQYPFDLQPELLKKFSDDYFRRHAAQDVGDHVLAWKAQRVYPFSEEPRNPVEHVERQVFDIVAVNIARYLPEFEESGTASKAFQLRMLRQAIEKSPQELQLILSDVLALPKDRQRELAELLRDVSLSAIIGSARVVADRLLFLSGLEAILFDDEPRQRLKERSQLHRIVAQNPWLFGDEFALSVDDRSLTEVLRKHQRLLDQDAVIDAPVRHVSQERGIVDLMLSKAVRRHRANSLTHLVVELKAPMVRLDRKEVSQIEGYAASVMADARFRNVEVQWQFWAVGDDLSDFAKFRVGRGDGVILDQDNCTVVLKTWAQIIDENRARLQFFQEKLAFGPSRQQALGHLQAVHGKQLVGVLDGTQVDR